MIFEGEFYAGDHLRWNLGWPTPNYAGAFVATLVVLGFAFSQSRWRWVGLAIELGGFWLLAKTYSRGAAVAWLAAWLWGVLATSAWREARTRWLWGARLAGFAAVLVVTGFMWSRAAETGAGEDRSVSNRWSLWKGGTAMIASAPIRGWGAGESGRAYMNWFQGVDRTEGYATMVNSYLHVAVERGLPLLGVVIFGLAWLLTMAWREAKNTNGPDRGAFGVTRPTLVTAAGASLVGWAMVNFFTTLWIEPLLWIAPGAAGVLLVWQFFRTERVRVMRFAFGSAIVAIVAVAGLYGAGRWMMRNQPLHAIPGSSGTVIIARGDPTASSDRIWHLWTDATVVGPTPGKELRRWLETQPPSTRLVMHPAAPFQLGSVTALAAGVMLFGRQVERYEGRSIPECRELWLIHPLSPPPAAIASNENDLSAITVILPCIDEAGNGPAWREWALRRGARSVESAASGLDIRAAWPLKVQVAVNP